MRIGFARQCHQLPDRRSQKRDIDFFGGYFLEVVPKIGDFNPGIETKVA
jgi:hypothetical protein